MIRKAFTMIELVFVIVILGILAAIAIPTLVANKNDAYAARIALELGDCIEMASAAYAKNGSFDTSSASCNDVTILNPCFEVDADDGVGSINVMHTVDAEEGSICNKAQLIVERNNLSSGTGVDHSF